MHLSLDMRDITTRVKVFCILNESGHFHMYFNRFWSKLKITLQLTFYFNIIFVVLACVTICNNAVLTTLFSYSCQRCCSTLSFFRCDTTERPCRQRWTMWTIYNVAQVQTQNFLGLPLKNSKSYYCRKQTKEMQLKK